MFLRYGAWQTEFFVIMNCFLPFYPPMDPENQNFEKMNKNTWRYFHFTKVYHKWQSYDLCFLRYGVQQTEFFAILDRFLPFYPSKQPENSKFWKNEKNTWRCYHFTQLYYKWQSHDVWFLRYQAWWTEFFVILDHFLLFYPSNNLKNQNFEKLKKTSGYIIILHRCTINDNHMMYGPWDIKWTDKIFVILHLFCPFIPPNNPKIQNFKKNEKQKQKRLEISWFYIHVPKIMIRWCTVPKIWCATDGWRDRQMDGRTDGKRDIGWVPRLKM